MARKKKTTKKSSNRKKAPSKKTGEALRKEAIATIDKNIAGTSKRKPKAKGSSKPKRERRLSGLNLAADIVAKAKEPLNAKTIADRAIAAGWQTSGKTPHATLYAAIIREIAAKGKDARFRKTDRGLFTSNRK